MMIASRPYSRTAGNHKLSDLLAGLVEVDSACERDIRGLSLDSRKTQPGDLFFACPGTRADGRDFMDQAVRAGAAAIVREAAPREDGPQDGPDLSVPIFSLPKLDQQMGIIAGRFYHQATREVFMVGVTGTNGKTSVSHYLAQALSDDKQNPCGLIGTLGYGLYGNLEPISHTTPDVLTLHALVAELRERGAQSIVMETSSHGLAQGRVNGIAFNVAVFTNLSRDHLDYHADMSAYGQVKRRLFEMPGLRHAVINTDDAFGRELLETLPAGMQAVCYGLTVPGGLGHRHVTADNLRLTGQGLEMDVVTSWGEGRLQSPLLGRFNVANLLAALATLLLMNLPLAEALTRLGRAKAVPGRMERFDNGSGQAAVVVDYAHTPDALQQALQTLREILSPGTRLWCVFGCGGGRDQGKRPLMGAVAEQFADQIIVTDDNPRHECGETIIRNILAGMAHPQQAHIERSRLKAIAYAVKNAASHDVVLIAGKGHEEYQLVGERKISYSDRRQVMAILQGMAP